MKEYIATYVNPYSGAEGQTVALAEDIRSALIQVDSQLSMDSLTFNAEVTSIKLASWENPGKQVGNHNIQVNHFTS